MSHYTRVDAQFLNKDDLIAAIVESGINRQDIEESDSNTLSIKYRQDKACMKVAAHKIGQMDDIAFFYNEDGSISPLVSDSGRYGKTWAEGLKQTYMVNLCLRQMKNQGWKCKVIVNGGVKQVVAEKL